MSTELAVETFVWDGNYRNREQVRPYMDAFRAHYDALAASGQYPYNDSFRGFVPGLAESEHEDTGIYMCQNLRQLDEDAAREAAFIATGGRRLDVVEPGKYARIVHRAFYVGGTGWQEYRDHRLILHNGSPVVMAPRARTHGTYLSGGYILVMEREA